MLEPKRDIHSSKDLGSLTIPARLSEQFRILFTGTLDAGKTTIAELFVNRPDVHVVREVARDLLSSNPALESHPDLQIKIIDEQIKRELIAERSLKPFVILDRSYLDVICYSRYFGHSIDEAALIKQLNYDKVLLFSPYDIDVTSTLSTEMQNYRTSIHEMFIRVLEELAMPYEIVSGDVQRRLSRIQDILISANIGKVASSTTGDSPAS